MEGAVAVVGVDSGAPPAPPTPRGCGGTCGVMLWDGAVLESHACCMTCMEEWLDVMVAGGGGCSGGPRGDLSAPRALVAVGVVVVVVVVVVSRMICMEERLEVIMAGRGGCVRTAGDVCGWEVCGSLCVVYAECAPPPLSVTTSTAMKCFDE